jgi:hypothetical protein
MPTASDTIEWRALRAALVDLTHAETPYALIVNARGDLVCSSHDLHPTDGVAALAAARSVLATASPPLLRGGKIDGSFPFSDGRCYAQSYANCFVLMILVADDSDDPLTELRHSALRRAVRGALPAIEALTLALPPPDGPGDGSVASFGTA